MIQALINAFDNDISNCLTETNSIIIEVFDCYDCTQQRCYIKNEENQPTHFELGNPQAANLVFVALDNCILQSHQQSRCDFVIGNLKKLYFVEIKRVKKRQKSIARTNATQQLGFSIQLFKEKINLDSTELVAVICFTAKQTYPFQSPKPAYPYLSATSIEKRVAFRDNYNADLMEGQSHTF